MDATYGNLCHVDNIIHTLPIDPNMGLLILTMIKQIMRHELAQIINSFKSREIIVNSAFIYQ